MGKLSREKGKRYERHICSLLREAFPGLVVRRASQADRAYMPDVVIENLNDKAKVVMNPWIECNHARRVYPEKKYAQAVRDIAETHITYFPIVCYREHGNSKDLVYDGAKHYPLDDYLHRLAELWGPNFIATH